MAEYRGYMQPGESDLSLESRAIIDKLKSKGYPLPQVITNESLRAEA